MAKSYTRQKETKEKKTIAKVNVKHTESFVRKPATSKIAHARPNVDLNHFYDYFHTCFVQRIPLITRFILLRKKYFLKSKQSKKCKYFLKK